MVTGFRRSGDALVAVFGDAERDVLARLFGDVALMLEDGLADGPAASGDPLGGLVGMDAVVEPPQDPALARLLPAGTRDDDERAADFRRFTDGGLRRQKSTNLRVAVASLAGADGDEVRLDQREATAWLTALTDTRLVLAERLGIRTEEDADRLRDVAEAGADGPVAWMALVYDFLAWVQESLLGALTGQ